MRKILAAGLVMAPALGLAACGNEPDPGSPLASAPAAFAQCKMCHALEPGQHGIGPSLSGVGGSPAAQASGFAYSSAMRESGLVWDAATLDAYLKNPRAAVPGTSMSYAGLRDDAARAELVEWLMGV